QPGAPRPATTAVMMVGVMAERTESVGGLLDAIAGGQAAAAEVVSAHLAALHRVAEQTHAIAAFNDDRALADARRLDQAYAAGGVTGPLHGLPVTVKDWIDVEGFPCAGESGLVDRRPERDATVIARLRQAGAVVVAKTHAWGPRTGATIVRHPADPGRTPGRPSTRAAAP